MAMPDFQTFEFLIQFFFFKKPKFLEKPIKKTKRFMNFPKTGIYVLQTSICYAHAKFWGNPSIFSPQIAQKKREKHVHQNFEFQFFHVLDYLKNKHTTIEFTVKN